jgi:hypothetical protein
MVAITESAVKELLDPDSFFLSTCIALSFYLEMRSKALTHKEVCNRFNNATG